MLTVDLGIFWEWEYDREFVLLLDRKCQKAGLSSYLVHPYNFEETREKVARGDLRFRHVLDRASDVHEGFAAMASALQEKGTIFVNRPEKLPEATDKATMHLKLMEAGIHVPYSILLDPFQDAPFTQLCPNEMERVGSPFIVKPAQGGGGVGVVLGATLHWDVVKARAQHCGDRYLVQEEIVPETYRGNRAWFRVFYVCGQVIPCWWNDRTKLYRAMTTKEQADPALAPLKEIVRTVAGVCGLNFFSSEIAKCGEDLFVVVDYVNDICDMRLAGSHPDGVPDRVVREITEAIVEWVKSEDRRHLHPSS